MADIIEFPADDARFMDGGFSDGRFLDGKESEMDSFLRDEGLELLASFRAIKDAAVRRSLLTLVRDLAKSALAQPVD